MTNFLLRFCVIKKQTNQFRHILTQILFCFLNLNWQTHIYIASQKLRNLTNIITDELTVAQLWTRNVHLPVLTNAPNIYRGSQLSIINKNLSGAARHVSCRANIPKTVLRKDKIQTFSNFQQSDMCRKDFKRQPGFDPITFTFSENSNYGRESLLEV